MSLVRLILGVLLILGGGILYLFFSRYTGDLIKYNWLWFFSSIISVVIGGFLLKGVIKRGEGIERQDVKNDINSFKKSAKLIKVDLNKCDIKTNNYVKEEPTTSSPRVQMWDSLYDSSRNVIRTNVNQAVLIYRAEINGEKMVFSSQTIFKDEITLRFQLELQKETSIYYDPVKYDYYFDVEFLMD